MSFDSLSTSVTVRWGFLIRAGLWGMLAVSWAGVAYGAESFCMSAAETYYQQLYCEVKARGAGRGLPSFADFKKNDATVQALLLKRPARSLGIRVAMPKRHQLQPIATIESTPRSIAARPERAPDRAPATSQADTPVESIATQSDCRLTRKAILCGSDQYLLVGNQRNDKLIDGALSEGNKMALPIYRASLTDGAALNLYLLEAYRRYLEKMLEIGLGGATMSYGKFTRLYRDLASKGVNFTQRFETMYAFLKKDKRILAVSERVRLNRGLALSDCGDISDTLIVCSRSGRNYVYRRSY